MSKVVKCKTDPEALRPLVNGWYEEQNGKEFGVSVNVDKVIQELQEAVVSPDSDVLLFIVNDKDSGIEVVGGFVAVYVSEGHAIDELVCKDLYIYLLPKYRRGKNGNKLIQAMEEYAMDRKCKYTGLTVSNISGNRSDGIKRLYRRQGYQDIETSFLKELSYG